MGHIIFKQEKSARAALKRTKGCIKGIRFVYKSFAKFGKKSGNQKETKSNSNASSRKIEASKPLNLRALKKCSTESREERRRTEKTDNQKSQGASSLLSSTFSEVSQNHQNDNLGFTGRFLFSRPSAISMRFRIRTTSEGKILASPLF